MNIELATTLLVETLFSKVPTTITLLILLALVSYFPLFLRIDLFTKTLTMQWFSQPHLRLKDQTTVIIGRHILQITQTEFHLSF